MKFYKHQQELINKSPRKYGLWWDVGTGKSITVLQLFFDIEKENKNCLIICPKSVKENWRNEIVNNYGEQYLSMFQILTKEEFKKFFMMKKIGRGIKVVETYLKNYDCLIVDEFHYFLGKSQMNKCLKYYVKKYKPEYFYTLSGTVYNGSNPWMIYELEQIFRGKFDYMKFKMNFFIDKRFGNKIIPVPREDRNEDLQKIINMFGERIRLNDCFDIPEQIFKEEYFELTKEQEKEIKKIKREEINFISKWTKIYQIINGTLKSDGYTENKIFDCEKIERLKELVNQHPKVAIICKHNLEIERIKNEFKDVFIINGQTKNVQEICDKINNNDKGIILINAMKCEGYDLNTIPVMIFYSMSFSLKDYVQMKGRIQRAKNIKKNIYIHLITKNTIDEKIYEKVVKKEKDFILEEDIENE